MPPMAEANPATPPLFVVGSPRSGTTLLAAMLGAHPALDCGPETRFFSWLADADRASLLDPATWPDAATDFVCGLALRDSPVHLLFGVSREQVRASLAAREPSVRAMLESLTVTRMRAHGKSRWAEKTPRHLEALAEIRREWPDATIVRVVRDPRDVALSLVKVPFGGDSVVVALTAILAHDRMAQDDAARGGRMLTIRYEDLVTDPAPVLRRVCEAAGIPFDPAMIDRRDDAAAIAAPHETWKAKASQPLDPSRIGGWRTEMDPAVARFAALHLREVLRAHGYEGAREPRRTIALLPLGDQVAVRFEPFVLALAAQDSAIAEPPPLGPVAMAACDELVFWGNPGQLGLDLGRGATARTAAIVRLAALLAGRRLRRRPAAWVRRHTNQPEHPGDPGERATELLLRAFARTVRPRGLPPLLGLPRDAMGTSDE